MALPHAIKQFRSVECPTKTSDRITRSRSAPARITYSSMRGCAGASSISELQLLGKPSILVPSPNVAEDHQTKNALALAHRNAAIMVTDADAPTALVDTMLQTVMQTEQLNTIAANVKAMALNNAAEKIVDKVMEIINQ